MEERTDEARVNLPSLFNNLFFQEASLICIFSIIKKKSLLFALPLRIGKPKYLSREVVLLIPEIEVSLLILTN
jgi:hypothetical protein